MGSRTRNLNTLTCNFPLQSNRRVVIDGVTQSEKAHRYANMQLRRIIVSAWNYIFNAEVSPLRHITDASMRHYVLQALGLMWALASTVAIGSYTVVAVSIVGHTVLIGAAAITVATYTAAAVKPDLFRSRLGRRHDGEHE